MAGRRRGRKWAFLLSPSFQPKLFLIRAKAESCRYDVVLASGLLCGEKCSFSLLLLLLLLFLLLFLLLLLLFFLFFLLLLFFLLFLLSAPP